jgi:hypothetical protein
MDVVLKPSWILTTDHPASSYGQPVLVNRGDRQAFGPADIVEPYPSWGLMPASLAVLRMAKTAHLDAEGMGAVEKFCRLARATATA